MAAPCIPDVWDVVELCHDIVPMIRSSETVALVYLRAKVSENQNGGLVWAEKNRSDEQFKVFHCF